LLQPFKVSIRPASPTPSFADHSVGADASQLRMYVLDGLDGPLHERDYLRYSDQTQSLQARSDTCANHVSDPNNPDSDSRCAS
jgi:hypothetical protein